MFYIVFTISIFILLVYNYIFSNFSNISLDQLIYSANTAEGTDTSVIIKGIFYIFFGIIIIYCLYFFLLYLINKLHGTTYLNFTFKKQKRSIKIFPFNLHMRLFSVLCFLVFTIIFVYIKLDVASFLNPIESSFIEKNYVDPTDVSITAPEMKKNLIHIYVESLESTFLSIDEGGAFKKAVTPNLEKIAIDNLNFSNNEKIGGGIMNTGTHYTVAGMVAQTAGVPLKIPLSDGNKYSKYDSFLPGVYTIGEILKDNGYHNYFMLGSDANFGGRRDYFSTHGDYTIYDYNYGKDQKWIDSNYYVWWGYEDSKLFKFSKKQLKKIASEDEPFNFTILTANTHFIDGYVDGSCDAPYTKQYLNSFYCSDREIGEFINWLKKQDFYENTVVVITGDHLTMQTNIVDLFETRNYRRTVFNTFINSGVEPVNNKNRQFDSFDIYPTTLASLGFDIDGDRLGLGTNLFSSKKTLTEEFGNEYIENELKMKSNFYNDALLGKTYREMILDNKPKNSDL